MYICYHSLHGVLVFFHIPTVVGKDELTKVCEPEKKEKGETMKCLPLYCVFHLILLEIYIVVQIIYYYK